MISVRPRRPCTVLKLRHGKSGPTIQAMGFSSNMIATNVVNRMQLVSVPRRLAGEGRRRTKGGERRKMVRWVGEMASPQTLLPNKENDIWEIRKNIVVQDPHESSRRTDKGQFRRASPDRRGSHAGLTR
jgi:hypothetical protein